MGRRERSRERRSHRRSPDCRRPTAEEIGAVSLSKLYVYYGSHENRSREGEGVWLVLNPGKKDLTA